MNNNIKGLFVPYEIGLKLKEKGFNEQCLAFFNGVGDDMIQPIDTDFINYRSIGDCVAAPLWQQVIDWLREKHGYIINIDYFPLPEHIKSLQPWTSELYSISEFDYIIEIYDRDTYEKAREQVILKALELI